MSKAPLVAMEQSAGSIFHGPPSHALEKCRDRWSDFRSNGWTKEHLVGRDPKPWGYHGLAWILRAHQDLARIFPYCVEILGRQDGRGERARLYYWKGEPYAMLVARYGKDTIYPKPLKSGVTIAQD